MNKESTAKRTFRRPLSTLGKVALGALLINVIGYVIYVALIYQIAGFIALLLLLPGSMLVAAALVATGARWAPAVGAAFAIATTVGTLARPENPYTLTHPGVSATFFSLLVLILASAAVAIITGIWATLQNEHDTPHGLRTGLVGLIGLVSGMILVSFLVAANPYGEIAATSTGRETTVHMGVANFSQNIVQVAKGSNLKLVDDGPFQHILENGMWNENGLPVTKREPGAPAVNNLNVTGGSVEIGPFTTAGIFHLYCTIHQGMNLTVLVQ